jgi:glucosamine--fructose-6-phosphate aminotransferase (isomerizing)
MAQAMALEDRIKHIAEDFVDKHHALFLGRGTHFPIALEGALKLKEISYIHAEAYPAGELKHGPLALVDEDMPVVTVAPDDHLLGKLRSNLEEVRARGGQLINFIAENVDMHGGDGITNVQVPGMADGTSPIIATLPLQLLAYHVALLKGTDVDKPRNLAKSVTVE